jgi:RNA polymerase sigma factor (sigma-70 family)
MSEDHGSVTRFLNQMMAGDEAAVTILWERFLPRLLGLARRTLGSRPQRVADAQDAVQSAFASFWKRAVDGQFGAEIDRNDLWNLLGVITVRKSLRQARHERATRRGAGRVLTEGSLIHPNGTPQSLDDFAAHISPVELDFNSTELLNQLPTELREIAVLRLLGYLNSDIASQLGCSERTIERKLADIRECWKSEMTDS